MFRTAAVLASVALAAMSSGLAGQSAKTKPVVTPFFSLESEPLGPAFFIECRNDTGAAVSSASRDWAQSWDAVRIDGGPLGQPSSLIGPGLSQPIPSGETWRGIVELRPAAGRTSFAVVLGAHARVPLIEPLRPGRHVIAVRCFGEWSDGLTFYWQR